MLSNSEYKIETGSAEDARNWIKLSNLDEVSKERLSSFVEKFNQAPFFRYESKSLVKWPGPKWLKDIWSTVAFMWPDKYIQVEIGESPYTLYLGKFLMDVALLDMEKTLQDEGINVFTIGEDLMDPGTVLLVADDEPKIYSLYNETIWDFKRRKKPLEDALGVLYDNYFDMLDDISKVEAVGKNKNKLWP